MIVVTKHQFLICLPFSGLKELHFIHQCKLHVCCFAMHALAVGISDEHLSLTRGGGCRMEDCPDRR